MKKVVRRQPVPGSLGDTLIDRLFANRGITHPSQVDHQLKHLLPPTKMKGIQQAAALLADCVRNSNRILIVGDFDADGATSSALMVLALRAMGAADVQYIVPNRFEYGYGLTREIVDVARGASPDLLITVDNGISSIEGVAHAKACGIQVIVTDHHLPASELPDADAIVNPNQPGCEFPSKNLAGVGVAFYLLSATRQALLEAGWFDETGIAKPNLAQYLDLVALGTIADVVPLDYNNRILAQEGIRRLAAGRGRPGMLALMQIAGARPSALCARDLSFGVAPRLNAAGRLEDMSLGIECLIEDNPDRAMELATQLDALNKERREIENEMKQEAQAALSAEDLKGEGDSVGICLFREHWHQGVVGIVASRIKDKLHRPVIAFAQAAPDELKGSARSIPGLHIRDALDTIAAKHPGLLLKFGGHAMAAGLSLRPENFNTFEAAFDEEARRWLTEDDLEQVVVSDGEIEEPLTLDLVREVMQAAPWGQGFAEPVFDSEFEILEQRIVGGNHLKLKVRAINDYQAIDAIAFNHGTSLLEGRYQRLAYRIDINEFRTLQSVQLIIEAAGSPG